MEPNSFNDFFNQPPKKTNWVLLIAAVLTILAAWHALAEDDCNVYCQIDRQEEQDLHDSQLKNEMRFEMESQRIELQPEMREQQLDMESELKSKPWQ